MTPLAVLARHFVAAILAPPLLTELGADYLRRTLASLFAMLLVVGIFVTRAMFRKYVDLHASWDVAAYLRAVESDTLLMIALPMLVIGLAATLLAPTLFPGEIDYRTLASLPLQRSTIFTAKLAAAFIVIAAAVGSVNAVTSLWFPVAIGGRWMPYPLGSRVAAHAVASLAGSTFMFTAVMACQGACLVLVPTQWRMRAAVVAQGAIFSALLLAVPFVLRISALNAGERAMLEGPMQWIPAAWFLGVERWMLDPASAGYAAAAWKAVLATGVAASVVVLTYFRLYQDAEALASDVSYARTPAWRAGDRWLWWRPPQPTRAVAAFLMNGLRRSVLHHTVFLLIACVGAAAATALLLRAGDAAGSPWGARAAVHTALAVPLLVALTMTLALRAVALLPLDANAGWIFRLSERPATRPQLLTAVWVIFSAAALVPAIAAAFLLQARLLGTGAAAAAVLTTLATLLLVEIVLRSWSRVPYTCTYLPGKRVLAYSLGVIAGAYFVFVYIGAHLIRWGLASPSRALVLGGTAAGFVIAMRRARRRAWADAPLEFEDEDPLAIRTLNLLADDRR